MNANNASDVELKRLNEIVVRIIRLKDEDRPDDAIELCEATLENTFNFSKSFLEGSSTEEFELKIKERNYAPDQLEILIRLLFESEYPFQETAECRAVMHKVALLLKVLEKDDHQLSLKHLNTREMVDHYLNNDQFE